jgi:hypothetical protein
MAARTLDTLLPVDGTSDFQLQMAALPDAAQQQARNVLEEAAANGTLDDLDLDEVISNAQVTDEAREEAEDLQVEQAKATADGDFEKARELSDKAEYELREVEDKGDDPLAAQAEIRDADYDQMDLDNADFHQEIAEGNTEAAVDAAEAGDFETAEELSDSAANEIEASEDFAGNGAEVEDAEDADAYDQGVETV